MNDQLFWFATRGAGTVTLIFTTAVVYLGILSVLRWRTPAWPPFATAGFHKNLSLLTVVFLAIHVLTAALDPFVSLGFVASLVPFVSAYEPFWMALGIVALYLFAALIATSLLRNRIGARTWRAVHWTAYGMWPLAVLHTLGMGTDATAAWMVAIVVACVAAVGFATLVRVTSGRPAAAPVRPRPGQPLARAVPDVPARVTR